MDYNLFELILTTKKRVYIKTILKTKLHYIN